MSTSIAPPTAWTSSAQQPASIPRPDTSRPNTRHPLGGLGDGPSPITPSISQASGGSTPFQQLAADIQALLVGLQGGNSTTAPEPTPTTGATTSTTGGSAATAPLRQLAADLQAMLAQLQANGSNQAARQKNADEKNTDQTGAIRAAQGTGAPTARVHPHPSQHLHPSANQASGAANGTAATPDADAASEASSTPRTGSAFEAFRQAIEAYNAAGTTPGANAAAMVTTT